jgi:hypothetical protein
MFNNEFLKFWEELSILNEGANQNTVHYTLDTIGGFDNGKVIPASEEYPSLAKYLQDESQAGLRLKTNDRTKIAFKCPKCNSTVEKTGKALYGNMQSSKEDGRIITADHMVTCASCLPKKRKDLYTEPSKIETIVTLKPDAWARIPSSIFKDKSEGEQACLSKEGLEILKALNQNNSAKLPDNFKQNVLDTPSEDYKVVLNFTKASNIIVPFVCDICKLTYNTRIAYAIRNAHCGCSSCTDAAFGAPTSASEICLKEAIASIFGKDSLQPTPPLGRYRDIDILFLDKQNRLIGIEYDGAHYHQTEKQLATDIAKMNAFSNKHNIKFIRVKEKVKDPALPESEVPCIVISQAFLKLATSNVQSKAFEEALNCIRSICEYVDYSLTDQDYTNLIQVLVEHPEAAKFQKIQAEAKAKKLNT